VIALVLLVDVAAISLSVWSLGREPIGGADIIRFVVLVALGGGYFAASRRIDQSRRLLGVLPDTVYVHVDSAWTLPAAILLPRGLALVVVLVNFGLLWRFGAKQADTRPPSHQFVYSVAGAVLSCQAAASVAALLSFRVGSSWPVATVLVLAIAILTYLFVNTLIVAAAIHLSTGAWKPSALLGSWSENGLEVATLGLGAVTALSILYAPWAAVLVLPAVFLLQHQALLRQLVAAATTDVKTELLNATAWRQVAQREIDRAGRRGASAAILVLDMDHFKRINDQHGHLAGDAALKSVGAALADELRGYDAVGRFGGEEFVAVLPDTDTAGAEHAAQRLRRRIEALRVETYGETISVTASIGVALCPEHGDDLDDVLRAADDAMYDAKRAGRNAVRAAPPAAWLRTAAS
jgi:diguanylate cyclase (GGDEF)-like protein